MIGALHQRADASRRRLILRDYNYIEFVGVPYTDKPQRRRIIYDALPADVPVKSIAFIRHPIHQWLSLCKHEHVRARLSASSFCEAYLFFLRDLGDLPLFKYEEFVEQPSSELRRVCNELDLQFDPSFLERFHPYD